MAHIPVAALDDIGLPAQRERREEKGGREEKGECGDETREAGDVLKKSWWLCRAAVTFIAADCKLQRRGESNEARPDRAMLVGPACCS